MAKTKTITIDNYKQFKPSELVHSFVSDLDAALKTGKSMDMSTFNAEHARKVNCLPCLGGMALLNLGAESSDMNGHTVLSNIANMGDFIRMSCWTTALVYLTDLYPKYTKQLCKVSTEGLPDKDFAGVIYSNRIKALQKHILKFVEVLEKAGC